MGRFDDQREAQFRGRRNTIGLGAKNGVAWRRNPEAVPDLFGAQLVHRQCRRQDAAAGVGNAQAFEQALHAAVFTATTVEDDEGAIDFFVQQTLQQVIADVEAKRVHTGALKRFENRVTRLQGNLTLGTLAAEEHGDAAEIFRRDRGDEVGVGSSHFNFPTAGAAMAPANNGLFNSFGARPPISPAPWHSRMSPARSSGLTIGARSTPRSM